MPNGSGTVRPGGDLREGVDGGGWMFRFRSYRCRASRGTRRRHAPRYCPVLQGGFGDIAPSCKVSCPVLQGGFGDIVPSCKVSSEILSRITKCVELSHLTISIYSTRARASASSSSHQISVPSITTMLTASSSSAVASPPHSAASVQAMSKMLMVATSLLW